jgi:hypothetical protein
MVSGRYYLPYVVVVTDRVFAHPNSARDFGRLIHQRRAKVFSARRSGQLQNPKAQNDIVAATFASPT